MAKDFEEMDSTGMFGHLMDQSSEKMKWNRSVAVQLLEEADWLEDLAEKYRHLAATMILEAQDFGKNTADLLAKEFPMGNVNDNA
jgi:hypothetical protein